MALRSARFIASSRSVELFRDEGIVSAPWTQLSWSHFIELLSIKDSLARDFSTPRCAASTTGMSGPSGKGSLHVVQGTRHCQRMPRCASASLSALSAAWAASRCCPPDPLRQV